MARVREPSVRELWASEALYHAQCEKWNCSSEKKDLAYLAELKDWTSDDCAILDALETKTPTLK